MILIFDPTLMFCGNDMEGCSFKTLPCGYNCFKTLV